MIYLLWAAIFLQGCLTAWLARALNRVASVSLEFNKHTNNCFGVQIGLNDRVIAKLRALGQPLD